MVDKTKTFKRVYYFIFFTALSLGLLKVYDKLVDGFYISRIYGFLEPRKDFDLKHNLDDMSEMNTALKNSFSYLASGSQCYVFISDDGQYILKLFKNYRWKIPFVFKLLPKIPYLTALQERIEKKKFAGALKTYTSAKLSYTTLKDKTALIYLQLNIKPQNTRNVVLYNRLKKKYTLDLAQVPFALQRYAKPIPTVLLEYKKNQDIESAKKCIDDLLQYVLERRSLNITDSDPHFINNFGYIDQKPISLDIGGLLIDPKKDENYFYTKELDKISKKLKPWVKKNFPEIESYITSQLAEINNQKKKESSCF